MGCRRAAALTCTCTHMLEVGGWGGGRLRVGVGWAVRFTARADILDAHVLYFQQVALAI